MRGATIHPSDDPERKTPARGYFLAARSWNRRYLTELARVTGKTMRIEPALAGPRPSAEIVRQSGEITFTRPLPGPRGKAELMLTASLQPGWIAVALRSGRSQFVQQTTVALLAVLGLSLVLWFWVTRPLGWIRRSLESGSTETLKPLERNRTEFGQLAQLVGQFLGQNAALVREVTERNRAEEVLRTSEAQLSNAMEIARLGYWEYDVVNDLFTFNDHFYSIFRTTAGKVGGYRMSSAEYARRFVHPDDAALVGAEVRKAIETTDPHFSRQLEHRIIYADGSVGHISVRFFTIKDSQGRTVKTYGANQDVTERKLAESALLESEERFRGIFDAARDGIALADVETGRLVTANSAFCDMVDYSQEEIVRLSVPDFYPSESLAYVKETFEMQATGRASFTPDIPMKRRDGSVFYADINSTAVSLGGRNLLMGVFRDTTARRAAEAGLKESERKFRAIFNTASDGMILVDPDSRRFLLANNSCLQMLGYTADEVANLSVTDLHPQEELHFVFEQIGSFIKGETGRRADIRFKRKDGSLFPADTTPAGVMLGDKKCILIVFRDITEPRRAEEALLAKERELRRSNAELEQFAYVASHDLQEPLRMVGSYTQLLARRYEGKLDKDADEFIRFAVDGVARMQLLINDLLTYSRVGRRGKEPQPTDSGVALERALQNLKPAMEDSKGSVTPDSLPVVTADDRQLEQLFQNLVGNAIKYHGDEPPRVHVSAEHSNGWWTFAIKDNGIGIERQYHERIFQVFQRLHTRKEYSGTGIGLAVCTRIVERHGGRIWVESEPGNGSTFRFTLPAKGA
jgi:PAS domain S-box-containing protein